MSKTFQLSAAANANPNSDKGSIFFIGTATVIIRFAGFTILTDPNCSKISNAPPKKPV